MSQVETLLATVARQQQRIARLEELVVAHHQIQQMTAVHVRVQPREDCATCVASGYWTDRQDEHWQPVTSGGTR